MSIERHDTLAEHMMKYYEPVVISPDSYKAFRDAAHAAVGKSELSPEDERKILLDTLRFLVDRDIVVSGD